MNIVTLVILFVMGALIGSFLNVCIYRIPRKQSIVSPGSHCPQCGAALAWYDNIPLFSYFMLGGRCRACGGFIAWRYPLVELLNAVLYVAAGRRLGITVELLPALLFISTMIVVFFIDLDHYIIPNVVVLPVAVVGLGAMVAVSLTATGPAASWWSFPLAGFASAAFFFAIVMIFPRGMGMGDAKLAALLGFFLGRAVIVSLFMGFLLGALTGLVLIAAGFRGRRSPIPFGPFLAAGGLVALFYGNQLLDLYLRAFKAG